jgi:hypothetical protein
VRYGSVLFLGTKTKFISVVSDCTVRTVCTGSQFLISDCVAKEISCFCSDRVIVQGINAECRLLMYSEFFLKLNKETFFLLKSVHFSVFFLQVFMHRFLCQMRVIVCCS